MILGMPAATFTLLHIIISIVAIISGFIVVIGMFGSHRLGGWAAVFLVTTILTSAGGFLFPFTTLLPSHILGIISLVVLAVALLALYTFSLRGAWRWIYVTAAVAAVYFNVFVLIVQSFQKVPALQPLAPTQSEPPFQIAQAVALVLFVLFGIFAVRRFHPERLSAA